MNTKITLVSLFDKNRTLLEKELQGLMLPDDADKVQNIISNYLNTLFESDGEFRQQLTLSEDYILQAALSLLNAQQEIAMTLIEKKPVDNLMQKTSLMTTAQNKKTAFSADILNSPVKGINALVASSGGALIGNVLLGGWGTVVGSIAGTAVVIYLSQYDNVNKVSKNEPSSNPIVETSNPINSTLLINVVLKICESIDTLVDTFRSQINRVVEKYESQEKPSFEKEYRPLLEELQSLVGYERNHTEVNEKNFRKLKERIEDIVETLESWNLDVVEYLPEHSDYFEKIASPNTKDLKEVYPAILKNGNVVLLGKVFIPE